MIKKTLERNRMQLLFCALAVVFLWISPCARRVYAASSLEEFATAETFTDNTSFKELQEVLDLINEKRAMQGLSALFLDAGLCEAASIRAKESALYFSHTRPDGTSWWTVNASLVYGENLACGSSDPAAIVAAWMASPSHRNNLLEDRYGSVGIAIYQSQDGTWYWAQEFGL